MGMFTYSRNIPNPPDNPAFDVTLMQQNSQSINDLIAIEHQGFNTDKNVGGYHTHVTFAAPESTPALAPSQIQIYPTTMGSGTTYLENLISATTNGGVQFNGYLPFVKFMVNFSVNAVDMNLTPNAGYLAINVGVITQSNGGKNFTINFNTALPNNTYYIFPSAENQVSFSATLLTQKNASSIVLNYAIAQAPGTVFSFMVI